MKIKKLIIKNYKLFKDVTIEMNEGVNIFVGENDSGKTTILEAIGMVLTGKINGGNLINRFNLDWFNLDARNEFKTAIANGEKPTTPTIEVEAFLLPPTEEEIFIKKFKGTNNSLHEDVEGVKLEIVFDSQYCDAYKQLLSEEKINDIPIEFYKINFRSFANPDYYIHSTAKKVATIDATRKDFGLALNRFVSGSISEYLDEEDVTNLRHAYRTNRQEFTQSDAVKNLNDKLKENHNFDGKTISLNLRENEIDEWKNNMSISLDNIPLENAGYAKPFIPIVTEYMLIYHKDDPFLVSYSKRLGNSVDISQKDVAGLTWHHLIRATIEKLGGEAKLTDLYDYLSEHPKSKKNEHYKERIRATIYEHMVAETISQYVSSECSFRGIGVDSVIESLEGNDSERNSLLSDLWEND